VSIKIPVGVDTSGAVASIQAVTDGFNRLRQAAEAASKAGAAGGQSDALNQQLADIQRVEAALANMRDPRRMEYMAPPPSTSAPWTDPQAERRRWVGTLIPNQWSTGRARTPPTRAGRRRRPVGLPGLRLLRRRNPPQQGRARLRLVLGGAPSRPLVDLWMRERRLPDHLRAVPASR